MQSGAFLCVTKKGIQNVFLNALLFNHTDHHILPGGFCGSALNVFLEVKITLESPSCQREDNFWENTLYLG